MKNKTQVITESNNIKRDSNAEITPDQAVLKVLIAVPAYNEEATISSVVSRIREAMPGFDLLVVNDGSKDKTEEVLRASGVKTASHLCNLGYSRAIQTAIRYALACGYDALITLDADGQHQPEQIQEMYKNFIKEDWDYLIGSRYVSTHNYSNSPPGRRLGMQIFSLLTRIILGHRIYDTTSGLKIIRQRVLEPLIQWNFVDFHAESIIYLSRLGFRIGEYPIKVAEREQGQSMYSPISAILYPTKTITMVFLAIIQASLTLRKKR